MVLDLRVEDLIKTVGHDGSEIIHPELPEPACRRAFHIQEMMKVALQQGYAVTPFTAIMITEAPSGQLHHAEDPDFMSLVWANQGVLTGHSSFTNTPHAVAWNGKVVYDPIGVRYELGNFTIREFWMLCKSSCKSFATS
jgi:hypothetical protein